MTLRIEVKNRCDSSFPVSRAQAMRLYLNFKVYTKMKGKPSIMSTKIKENTVLPVLS